MKHALLKSSLLMLSASAMLLAGNEFHVSPGGSSSGDGSPSRPWDLATALAHPAAVKPGDTIWLRGGTYRGTFISKLAGTTSAPIQVRQYPGERATLDGNGSRTPVLSIGTPDHKTTNADTWYWGFEITNSHPNRADSTFTTFCPPNRCHGIYTYSARRIKFINLVIHDNALGIGAWIPAQEVEIYGNLIYHNGWEGTGVRADGTKDRAHGHAIYSQNNVGRKSVIDNIVFNQFDNGIQIYTGGGSATSPSYIDNYWVEGNTSFNNGSVSSKVRDKNILVGGGLPAKNPTVIHNYTYHTPSLRLGENALGYKVEAGWIGGLLRDNYFVGGRPMILLSPRDSQIYNNFGYGSDYIGPISSYPNNTFLRYHTDPSRDQRPKTNVVFVRPNRYEAGRAHVTIFNWTLQSGVEVDLTAAGLTSGQHFEIRDAQNYFGNPVAAGTYHASAPRVTIPMTGLQVVQPVGSPVRPAYHTAPEFGVYVVVPTSGTSTPPPPPPPPPPPATVATPAITPQGGTFTAPVSVSMTSATSGAQIRYTIDGSTPGSNSVLYSSPFALGASATVRAIAMKAGMTSSALATATLTINIATTPPPTSPPTGVLPSGSRLWLRAETGLTLSGNQVAAWADQSGNGVNATQAQPGRRPEFVDDAVSGKPAVQFDGADDSLSFRLPVNGLTQMTLILVGANTANRDPSWNGVNHAALLWPETQSWGSVALSPFQDRVSFRFGSGQANNLPLYSRPSSVGSTFTLTTAIKNGSTESLYVGGQQVYATNTALNTINRNSEVASLGGGFSGTHFPGQIAEVIVYARALTDAERAQAESYLTAKYFGQTANAAPTVSAGPARSVVMPNPAALSGSVTDDGKPSGTLTIAWSKVSGPGTVMFANPAAAATTASLSAAGSYVLRLTANDGALSSSSDVVVTATTAPIVDTTAPAVSALNVTPGNTGATLTWNTSEPASSVVSYGTSSAYGQTVATPSPLETAHTATISGLAPGTQHYLKLRVVDAAGNAWESSMQTFVTTGTAAQQPVAASVPTSGLGVWLRADQGITMRGPYVVTWKDQSPNGILAYQSSSSGQPLLVSNALNGKPALRFDGLNDWMAFGLPVNDLSGMTVFLVSANTAARDGSQNGVEWAPLFWGETGSWGAIHVSPFQSMVKFRFGTGEANNLPLYQRPAPIGPAASLTTVMKSGSIERLFVNGAQVLQRSNARPTISLVANMASIGKGFSSVNFFPGDIAEIIVYKRALSDTERASVDAYLKAKYGL